MAGYFGIGIENGKTVHNLGTLWRSAHGFGAAFLFTVGRRYQRQGSDTTKAWCSLPLINYDSIDHLFSAFPMDCPVIGVEYPNERAIPLTRFSHPKRCMYLLGAEDHGLSREAKQRVHGITMIPGSVLGQSLNVAVAGSIIMYDRITRG